MLDKIDICLRNEWAHSVIYHELVHSAWAERGAHGIHHRDAGIDIADQLRLPLARVRALPQQDDLRLLQRRQRDVP